MIKELINKIPHSISSEDLIRIISQQVGVPPKIVRKGIHQGQLKINDNVVRDLKYVPNKSSIEYQNKIVHLVEKTQFDRLIEYILNNVIRHSRLEDLYDDQEKVLYSYVIQYFSEIEYNVDELKDSTWNDPILSGLKDFARKKNLIQPDKKKKELVEELKKNINQAIRDFQLLLTQLETADLKSDNQILSQFGRTLKNNYLMQFVYPLCPELNIEKFILAIKSAQEVVRSTEEIEIITKSENNKQLIESCKKMIHCYPKLKLMHILGKFIEIAEKKTKEKVGDIESGNPLLEVLNEKRTYDVKNFPFKVFLNLKNSGDGIARDITITLPESDKLDNIKLLPPNQVRQISFPISKETYAKRIDDKIELEVQYYSKTKEEFKKVLFVEIIPQDEDLPWEQLRREKPYVISVIRDKSKFFGREALLSDLYWNVVESSVMSSYIIYGQKRIGKSSIARTLEDMVKDKNNIIFCYKSIGSIKNTIACKSFQKLSTSITKSILSEYRKKYDISYQYEIDSSQESLSDLIQLIEELSDIHDEIRFVIAIDEFDELNPEFFRDNEIGETLALNLGKGLNEMDNVSIFLIGSETMAAKSKQGMRLNTFESKRVDTFSKDTEFIQFSKIVTEPSKSCLNFDPKVVDWLYDFTNGNPYFTNLLCLKIFDSAYELKISYIDEDFALREVDRVINQLSKKEFEHFWVDGLAEEDEVLYKKFLERRQRVLFALASLLKEDKDTTWPSIKKRIKRPSDYIVTDLQWDETFNEFVLRNIFVIEGQGTKINPPLFQAWLIDKGLYQVIVEIENRDEFIDKINEEEKLKLSNEEISEIQKRLGDDVESKQLVEFFGQIESIPQIRNVADLLKEILYISGDQLSKHLKLTYLSIWEGTMILNSGVKYLRTDAEIISLNASYKQNQSSYNLIRESFKFPANKELKRESDIERIVYSNLKHLIIYEPLIDCPYYYRNSFSLLLKKIDPRFVNDITIHILTFAISDEAYGELQDLMTKNFAFNFKIHFPQTYQRNELSPFYSQDIRGNETWSSIISHFSGTSHTSSFVKIGSMVPYQTFPFLWMSQNRKKPLIRSNESSISDYMNFMSLSKGIQDLNLGSESKDREFKGSLAFPIRNHKKIVELSRKLKIVKSLVDRDAIKESIKELFKSTKKPKDSFLMHSIAKTLAAFYNTDGGVLYVGVEDDLTVIGLEADMGGRPYSEEEIRRIFDEICRDYLGNEYSSAFKLTFLVFANFSVLKVNTKKGLEEIWVKRGSDGKTLKDSEYQFYIRKNQESVQLSPKEYAGWIKNKVLP